VIARTTLQNHAIPLLKHLASIGELDAYKLAGGAGDGPVLTHQVVYDKCQAMVGEGTADPGVLDHARKVIGVLEVRMASGPRAGAPATPGPRFLAHVRARASSPEPALGLPPPPPRH